MTLPRHGDADARWRCVLVGSDRLLIECATQWQDHNHEVVAIVSDQPAIVAWAAQTGIPVLERAASLPQANLPPFDYLFNLTDPPTLPPTVLSLPRHGAIRVHDGVLSGHAGLNAPVRALLNGERHHNISWHLMTPRSDAGDLLLTHAFDIDEDDSALSVSTKCFYAARGSFAALIAGLAAGTIVPRPARNSSHPAPRVKPHPATAGVIDWRTNAHDIAQRVRALDHGSHATPVTAPKISMNGHVLLVGTASVQGSRSGLPAGTILSVQPEGMIVTTSTCDLRIGRISTCDGRPVNMVSTLAAAGCVPGAMLDRLSAQHHRALSSLAADLARFEPWWRQRLARRRPLHLPLVDRAVEHGLRLPDHADQMNLCPEGPRNAADRTVIAALVAYLGRIADRSGFNQARFDLGYSDPVLLAPFAGFEPWFSTQLPLDVALHFDRGLSCLRETLGAEIRQLRRKIGHAADLFARSPDLRGEGNHDSSTLPVVLQIVDDLEQASHHPGADLTIALRSDSRACRWIYDPRRLSPDAVAAMQAGFMAFLTAAKTEPDLPVGALPLINPAHLPATEGPTPGADLCLHQLFARQARQTPERPAVTCRDQTLTYAELDRRSNRLAWHLQGLGIGPDTLVGLAIGRSLNMIVALIAVHKAGGAYVPLSPAIPPERIAAIIGDCRSSMILTDTMRMSALPQGDAIVLCLDDDWSTLAGLSDEPVPDMAQPCDLAYVTYPPDGQGPLTGVMVEHRNVANFLIGMDHDIASPGADPGTWLAVTHLDCDRSVLDFFWTLCRGCHVIVATQEDLAFDASDPPLRPLDVSISCFPGTERRNEADQYRLLLESAKFADDHGFAAVWTPEHHFHAPDGRYPDPSVASTALAAVALSTARVQIRGGSVVLLSHHPLRVAEEWVLIDNLSQGRVGLSATGWHHDDAGLSALAATERFAAIAREVAAIRSLWQGPAKGSPGPPPGDGDGAVHPRPIQPDLPIWITSAGHDETFVAAGTARTYILTHLSGQTVEHLSRRIMLYRAAWKAAGHAGDGHVALMLPTFVGHENASAFEAIREALLPDHHPADILLGTPQECRRTVARMHAAGIDEIGCMIDFGLPVQQVLDHLPWLNTLREFAGKAQAGMHALTTLMERHAVTHLSCTPSMALALARDKAGQSRLACLHHLVLGGEPVLPPVAEKLQDEVGGRVTAMFGMAETTVWCAAQRLDCVRVPLPLGRALTNHHLLVLDSRQQPLPPGLPGELAIAGCGVARGYLGQDGRTAQSFIAHPLLPGARIWRSGMRAQLGADGTLEQVRTDHGQDSITSDQNDTGSTDHPAAGTVTAPRRHPGQDQLIRLFRGDTPGDVRQVDGFEPPAAFRPLRAALDDPVTAHLPEFSSSYSTVGMTRLPLPSNDKGDNPASDASTSPYGGPPVPSVLYVAPTSTMERRIAALWCHVLRIEKVGIHDDFFALGGHALLTVQLHGLLHAVTDRPFSLNDIFRFPTIHAFTTHLEHSPPVSPPPRASTFKRRQFRRTKATSHE